MQVTGHLPIIVPMRRAQAEAVDYLAQVDQCRSLLGPMETGSPRRAEISFASKVVLGMYQFSFTCAGGRLQNIWRNSTARFWGQWERHGGLDWRDEAFRPTTDRKRLIVVMMPIRSLL